MIRTLFILLILFLTAGCFSSKEPEAEKKEVATIAPSKEEVSKKEEPPSQETPAPAAQPKQPKSEPEQKVSVPSTPSKPAASSTQTEEQIKQKYHAELSKLQSYYSGKLSGLYGQAVQDLKAGKSAKSLYGQYAKQAGTISEESQAKVNQVLAKMKVELKANNFPISSVDQYRSIYNQEIGQAKSDALRKLREAAGF